MKIRHGGHITDKIDLQMTPMIDIVFQLLVFFIMSFKITLVEGDFNIRMPEQAPSGVQAEPDSTPPFEVKLTADADGNLTGIRLADRALASFDELHQEIRSLVHDEGGAAPEPGTGPEVVLDCDPQLQYRHVMDAVTAVTGYVKDGRIHTLVDKIRFTPRKGLPAGQ